MTGNMGTQSAKCAGGIEAGGSSAEQKGKKMIWWITGMNSG